MSLQNASRKPPRRLSALLALGLLPLGLASCEGEPVFGIPASRFEEILEKGELEPILALGPAELADPGSAGPEAYYYLARWLELRIPAEQASPPSGPSPSSGPSALPNGAPAPAAEQALPPALGANGAEVPAGTSASPGLAPRERLLAEELYGLAVANAKGLVQSEALRSLLRLLEKRARAAPPGSPEALAAWSFALAAARRAPAKADFAWEAGRLELAALEALGRDAELRRRGAELAAAFPAESALDPGGLLYYEAISSLRLGMKASPALLGRLLALPPSAWTEGALKALGEADPAVAASLGPALPAAARLRLAVQAKDYAAAYRAAAAALPLILSPEADPALVADAGKAYLYSGMPKEGLALFERLAAAAGAPAGAAAPSRPLAWNAAFYRARLLRALERWAEAAGAFLALDAAAPRAEDADAALWYGADSRMREAAALAASWRLGGPEAEKARAKRLLELKLAALLEIAPRWREPSRFSDLAEPLLREALAARDWGLIETYGRALGPRLAPTLGSRSLYIAARARELGYLSPPPSGAAAIPGGTAQAPSAAAAVASGGPSAAGGSSAPTLAPAADYRAILERQGGSLYYRLLASRRLGEELALVPTRAAEAEANSVWKGGREGAEASGSAAELRAFIEGFLSFRLGELGYAEALARLEGLGREELRGLAESFSRAGRHADSMRLVLALMKREDWDPRRRDYELLYPRPFLDEVRAIRPRPLAPEHLLYGLVRSESFFRHEVLSRAGAVGLSQLMPGTAAETARALGLGGYDLAKPADNLKIGFAHFGELLEETGGRPLRAMFAYNAGRGRLRRWLAESGELPEDLLLEALTIEETRQYGRNILEASAFYGELYYDLGSGEVVDELLEGLDISRR